MIKIYLLPDKGNSVFLTPVTADGCLMDTAVMNIVGFISYLEGRLGYYNETLPFNKRLCRYYAAARQWFGSNPDNIVARSFELSPLSTARALLQWRDSLRMAGWNFQCADMRSRLGALAGIESCRVVTGVADRLTDIVSILQAAEHSFTDTEVVLAVEQCLMRPAIQRLLAELQRHGATVTVLSYAADNDTALGQVRRRLRHNSVQDGGKLKLTPDGTLRVLEFDTLMHHDQYMAVRESSRQCCVWINPRSKETDNRLIAINRPTVGSSFRSASRVLDMLPLALSLYDEPLNIYKIVEWLSAPVHPLPARFRYALAQEIVNTGGFVNEPCMDIVNRYVEGDFEPEPDEPLAADKLAKKRAAREFNVEAYIPYISGNRADVARAACRTLVNLASWARQRPNALPDGDEKEALSMQLYALADSIDTLMMLSEDEGIAFDMDLARKWVNDIPLDIQLPHCPAQVGATFSVDNPHDVAAVAKRILWSGMAYEEPEPFDCDFLLPGEVAMLGDGVYIWNRQDEGRYRYMMSIMPFLLAGESLELAYAVKHQGVHLIPHPLITLLATLIDGFTDSYVERPSLDADKTCPVERVCNSVQKAHHTFGNASAIKLPVMASPTMLENFTMHPFDYMFERILGYRSTGLRALSPLQTTKGNVAHAVIAQLFSPAEGAAHAAAAEIRERFGRCFEAAFRHAVNDCGAILLLPENSLEKDQMKRQLRHCIESLIDIIDTNALRVEKCEWEASRFIDIHGTGQVADEADIHGRMDMVLTDAQGHHVIIDMKWTSSPRYYKSRLEENRSIQLAAYAHILANSGTKARTGYFVMPQGRLITTAGFAGSRVEVVSPQSVHDIMDQVLNSFRFRCHQLQTGVLEQGEDYGLQMLDYGQQQQALNLFPLDSLEGENGPLKAENRFSNYALFKGK